MTVDSTQSDDLRIDTAVLFGTLRARAVRIVVVTLLLVLATFVLLMFVPKQYESTATVLIEDRSNQFTQAATAPTQNSTGVSIDVLISSQIELIRSRDTLLPVIDSENLRSEPEFNGSAGSPLTTILSVVGRKPTPKSIDDTVLQNLNDRLSVLRTRDSAAIDIVVSSQKPELAAAIANAIAKEAVRRRAGQSVADTQEATVFLQQQIDQLRVKVEEAEAKVADYKANKGIFAGSNGTTLPDQNISDISKQITEAEALRSSAQQRATLIRGLIKSGQGVEGVDDVRNSAIVQSLMQTRATLQSSLAEKSATLLPAHPTIKALNAQIAQVNAQIKAEAGRVADGLSAQVTVEEGILASLNDDLTRAKLVSSTQTKDGVTLDSLTREANAQRDLLNAYLLKYRDASGRTDTGSVLPDVRQLTSAAPAIVPSSPKTGLILGAVAFVSLSLQVAMVLFGELTSGRAIYDRSARRSDAEEPEFESEPRADGADLRADDELQAEDESAEPDLFEPVSAVRAPQIAEPTAPQAEPEPASIPEATPQAPALDPRHAAIASAEMGLSNLNADIALGRARVVFLVGVTDARDAAVVADALVSDALLKGLSVCRVDAGSMRPSSAPGITDLCAEQVGFGDVVHKVREGLAEVPWGHLVSLERRSMRPVTLVEALADIYEVVIVTTGRVGLNSSLPVFAGAKGRLVTVRRPETHEALVGAAAADAAALGFEATDCVMVPELQSAVA